MCPSKLFTHVGPPGRWDSCYYLHAVGGSGREVNLMTMEEGRKLCAKLGANLLIIETKLEAEYIKVRRDDRQR